MEMNCYTPYFQVKCDSTSTHSTGGHMKFNKQISCFFINVHIYLYIIKYAINWSLSGINVYFGAMVRLDWKAFVFDLSLV